MNVILKSHLTKLSTQTQLPWLKLFPLDLLKILTVPRKPHMLSPFELMYGMPLIMGNLPPLASQYGDYLPILTQTQALLRDFANTTLPAAAQKAHITTITPGDYVYLKSLQSRSLNPVWTEP